MAFKKKQPHQAALKSLLYGPAGSGKTLTSLLMAEGLVKDTDKRIAMVDTEFGSDFYAMEVKERLVHSAPFDFDALETRSITAVLDEVKALPPKKYGAVIIDSATHIWESAKNAYEPEDGGEIPKHMWSVIKRPYKELMAFLLSSPMHVIICGREGDKYEYDPNTNEDRVVGKRMKGEPESDYEPHIVVRLKPRRDGDSFVHQAIVEKDRTGVLTGRIIEWPNYETLCAPIIHLLGGKQAQVETEMEVASKDASTLKEKEIERSKFSLDTVRKFEARFDLANTLEELEKVSKELTPEIKKMCTAKDITTLRQSYLVRHGILKHGVPQL
jgi:DNA polymerase III delta prime subunit